MTQEDMDFFNDYKMVREELERRANDGELFLWSPTREVKIEAQTVSNY